MTVRHVVKNPKQEGDKCIVTEWELAVVGGSLFLKGGRAGDRRGTFCVFSIKENGMGCVASGLPDDIGLATDRRGRIILDQRH